MRRTSRTSTARREGRGRVALLATLGLLLTLVAVSASPSIAGATSLPNNPATGLPPGQAPVSGGGGQFRTASAPAGARLNYYGGKVISNVQVTQVLYGTGTYTSEVSSTGAQSIAAFYNGVTSSPYLDWLSEYNTNITAQGGGAGTNQTIGRGTFTGQVAITPAASRNGSTIDDTAIQAELKAQIHAGVLPTPNANTLLAVYFPANKKITSGGQSSGVQFCAYHGAVAADTALGTPEFYYSVLPDFTTGGMATGCGGGTRYQNESSASSHEMVESITDPEVSFATSYASPLAWYDPTNGEIGDICNQQQGTVTGGDGVSYTVQKEFSNRYGDCIVQPPAATNDFSMAASPTTVSVTAGSSGTSTISTALTSGSAQSVTLSATGLPSGATASFSPTSVTAGSSSTLTLSTSSSTPAGSYPITVTGTGSSATHTTSVTLSVASSGGGSGGITNGGFETGNLSGWTPSGATNAVTTSTPHSGTYDDQSGATTPTNGDSSIVQSFTAPSGASSVSFWYKMTCPDTVRYDWATATLQDATAGTTATVLPKTCATNSAYVQVSATITAGHSYTLTLTSHDDDYAGDPSYTKFDDVTITTSAPASDFSIAASPTTVGVNQGGSGTSTISTAVTSGTAQSVALSATGLPSGATASFSPTAVTAGGSSTLTIGTSASTPPGTYSVTVTGTEGTATHSTPVSLTVTGNDFSMAANPTTVAVNAGSSGTSTISTVTTTGSAQAVALSASGLPSGATASFSPSSLTSGSMSTLTLSTSSSTPGGSYTVTITGTGTSKTHTTTLTLSVTGQVITGGITNGGFETGALSPWTATGASNTITTSGPHSGTYADQSGATTPTNGDSSIAQTFTAPTGATTVSFWYKMTCPDTVRYDWATAALKDNTTGTTTTVLPKTCATNSTWVQVTATVTAGHSYTLTLTSHDDNYPGDPSYTKFDDVTLS